MLQNLNKLKQFVLSSDDTVYKINTYNNLKIKDKTLNLIWFTLVHKEYNTLIHKLAIVDTKAFESQDWQATRETVGIEYFLEDKLNSAHNYLNNKQPNINWDMWKYSKYKKEDFLECGLPKGHYEFNSLKQFGIDFEKDDKDFSFLKAMNHLYKRFNENYIFIHKQLKEDEIILNLTDEEGNDFEVKFKISLDLISIDDRLYKSTGYPSQTTELIASYKVNYNDVYTPTVYDYTRLIETRMSVDFDLLKLKKQDLNLNKLESFINEEFSSYECEYKNPEWEHLEDEEIRSGKYDEHLYHTVDLTSQMKTSFNKLIDEALEEIMSNPDKYKKFN